MTTHYTPEHQWVRTTPGDDDAVVGITAFAQDNLGDVVFVELPEVGRILKPGEVAGSVESVKTAADVYTPVGGRVTEVNTQLKADPGLVNSDPEGTGWFFKLRLADGAQLGGLMDAAAYDLQVKTA